MRQRFLIQYEYVIGFSLKCTWKVRLIPGFPFLRTVYFKYYHGFYSGHFN